MTGARVGNWYLEAEIGRGAMGIVYRARGYDDPARRAAVKVFTGAGTQDPAFVQKFAAEMLPLQRLDHANAARFYDSGTHAGLAFVVCELVDGTDFAKLLEGGPRPWREVLSVAVQAARALKHAHNRNVLHRDLKPAHLMLAADGTPKVLGFGLAKVLPAAPPSPTPAIGSAAYIPPETASGKPLTRRSDFYSLGGVLYTLVTGRPPFAAASLVELMHKQCYTLPERPAMLVPDLPPELDEFICTLLDKNPRARRRRRGGAGGTGHPREAGTQGRVAGVAREGNAGHGGNRALPAALGGGARPRMSRRTATAHASAARGRAAVPAGDGRDRDGVLVAVPAPRKCTPPRAALASRTRPTGKSRSRVPGPAGAEVPDRYVQEIAEARTKVPTGEN